LTHRAGLTVSEIWDTPAERDAYFDEFIKPKLPRRYPHRTLTN